MTNEMLVIDEREVLGKEFRVYGDAENPLFLAQDVAEWIDYNLDKVNDLVALVDDDEKLTEKIVRAGQRRNMWFLTESGLYEVLMQSTKPIAKAFKKEVKQILHDIRKHGMFATPQKLEEMLNDPDTMIHTLQRLKAEQDARKALETKVEQDRPKVLFADSVSASESCILIGDFAKILGQNSIVIGPNRLFAWMREHGYLIKGGRSKNVPTERAMELGLFRIKETVITHASGNITVNKTSLLTGKGQTFFLQKFMQEIGN